MLASTQMLLLRLAANIVSHHRLSKGQALKMATAHPQIVPWVTGGLPGSVRHAYGSKILDVSTPLLTARRGCLVRDSGGHGPAEGEDNELVSQDNHDAAELARLLHA